MTGEIALDEELRPRALSWQAFDAPVASVLALHGEPVLDRFDRPDLLASLRGADAYPELAL
ncbi:MAG: hypothetical protein IT372_37085 [Polyangiaceae bacterium]|nr:hypothetical protein [Polyangiaceae bacterium]